MNVGDLRMFARTFGKWIYSINPGLEAEKLETVIRQFATTAPMNIAASSELSFEEFCQEVASGYTEGKSAEA